MTCFTDWRWCRDVETSRSTSEVTAWGNKDYIMILFSSELIINFRQDEKSASNHVVNCQRFRINIASTKQSFNSLQVWHFPFPWLPSWKSFQFFQFLIFFVASFLCLSPYWCMRLNCSPSCFDSLETSER